MPEIEYPTATRYRVKFPRPHAIDEVAITLDNVTNIPPVRGVLGRWFASNALLAAPQAAAPVAFALLALPLTGDAKSGAAIVMAMTAAQVLGAVLAS
jgi:hypothetical protein